MKGKIKINGKRQEKKEITVIYSDWGRNSGRSGTSSRNLPEASAVDGRTGTVRRQFSEDGRRDLRDFPRPMT